jgi:hypothetical protein
MEMSNHFTGLNLGSPLGDQRLDLCEILLAPPARQLRTLTADELVGLGFGLIVFGMIAGTSRAGLMHAAGAYAIIVSRMGAGPNRTDQEAFERTLASLRSASITSAKVRSK